MGYRRTNFRPIYDFVKFFVFFENSGGTLTAGSWFTNRHSAFENIEFHLKNSNLHFVGYHWSKFNDIKIFSVNSSITNDASSLLSLDLINFIDSRFQTSYEQSFSQIRLSQIFGSVFTSNNIVNIQNLFIDCDNQLKINSKIVNISTIIPEKNYSNMEIIGSAVCVSGIDSKIERFKINQLISANLFFEINDKGKTGIIETTTATTIQNNAIEIEIRRPFNLDQDECPDFIPLIRVEKNSEDFWKKNHNYTIDNIFPCPVSLKNNMIGIYKTDLFSGCSLKICFTDELEELCGFENESFERITDRSQKSLQNVLEANGLPKSVYTHKGTKIVVVNNMKDNEVIVDTNFKIQNIEIKSQNKGIFLLKNDMKLIEKALFRNCILNANNFRCNILYLFEVDLLADLAVANYKGEHLRIDEYTFNQLKYAPKPKYLDIYTREIRFNETEIYPSVPIDDDVIVSFYEVQKVIGGYGGFNLNFTPYLYLHKTINFTTNTYGGLYFNMISNQTYSPAVDIYYKAVLPADIKNSPYNEFRFHPNFLGNRLEMKNSFCGKNINISLSGMESINFSHNSLMCQSNTVKLNIPVKVEMNHSLLSGSISIPSLVINRKIYLNKGTYLNVDEFSNPDDDFLLHFKWTLSEMPFFNIKYFRDSKSTSYRPSIQSYAEPSNDTAFFASHEVYKFGIPFMCISDTDYKGNIFPDGIVFHVKNRTTEVMSVFNHIGPEASGDVCSYIIPYREEARPQCIKGPDNRVPWMVIIALSIFLMLCLIVICLFSIIKEFLKKKKEEEAKRITEESSIVMIDLIY